MEQPSEHKAFWKVLFIRAAGFGAGVSLIAVVLAGLVVWYINWPATMRPWNREAVTAKYADLYGRTGNPLVFTFRYTIENHTGRDYELPASDNLYKVLANGKGLERDATLKWDGGTTVPAGQKVNVGIHVEYEYTEGTADLDLEVQCIHEATALGNRGVCSSGSTQQVQNQVPKAPGSEVGLPHQ